MLYLDIVRVCSWLVNPLYILVFKLNNSWNRHIYHVWHLWNLAIIIEEKLISKNAVGFRGHWVSNSECGLIPVIIQITCRITVQTIWLKILCIVRHYSEILVDLFIIHYAGSMGQWKGVEVGGFHCTWDILRQVPLSRMSDYRAIRLDRLLTVHPQISV